MSEVKIAVPNNTYYLPGSVNTKSGVQQSIKNLEEAIEGYVTRLKMIAIADPKTFKQEGQDIIYTIGEEVYDAVNGIREDENLIARLEVAEDILDDWKYGKHKIDTDTEEGFKRVTINDNYKSCKTVNYFDLKDYTNLQDYVDDCVLDVESQITYVSPVIVKYNDRVIRKKDFTVTFDTVEEAESYIRELISPELMNVFNVNYIRKNPEFIKELRTLLDPEHQQIYDQLIESLTDESQREKLNIDNMLHLISVITNQLADKLGFEIIQL